MYPQGINFRRDLSYVTDGPNDAHEPGNPFGVTYPWTTAQGNTVGWEGNVDNRNRNAGIDPRLAGVNFIMSSQVDFRFDLPAAGNYNIRLASGDGLYAQPSQVSLYDTASSLGTLATGSTSGGGQFKDATDTQYSSANWPGSNTFALKTFATTICRFRLSLTVSSGIAHAYVEAAGGGGGGFFGSPVMSLLAGYGNV